MHPNRWLSIAAFLLLSASLCAQPSTLYVSVLQTQSYIVGGKNPPTGLYLHQQDTVWQHLGWDNVRNFGVTGVPHQPDTIFLACGNGVFRTLNGGLDWKITTGWEVTEVLDVALSPDKPGRMLAATAYGIWASDDYGNAWRESSTGIEHPFTQTVRFDRTDGNRVLAGSEETLYLSREAGASWHAIGPADVAIRTLEQSPVAPDLWLAGTMDKGILVSRDGGSVWTQLDGGIRNATIYAIAFHPDDPNRIAAGGFHTGVFLSTDGGETWQVTGDDLPVFDPDDPSIIWAGTVGRGVYYTENAGADWHYAGLNGAEIWDMTFIQ